MLTMLRKSNEKKNRLWVDDPCRFKIQESKSLLKIAKMDKKMFS